jgi:hypothetical protein
MAYLLIYALHREWRSERAWRLQSDFLTTYRHPNATTQCNNM